MVRKSIYNIKTLQELDFKLVKAFDEPEPKFCRDTIIEGFCKTHNCKNTFNKKFQVILNKTGPYCVSCIIKNNKKQNTNPKIKWTYETLKNLNITLLSDYSQIHLSGKSKIEGVCKNNDCSNTFKKDFRSILTNPYCNKCVNKSKLIKVSNTFKNNSKYTIEILQNLNITLLEDYSQTFLKRRTKIKAICKNEDCSNTFKKNFEYLLKGGLYCDKCTINNQKLSRAKTNIERYGVENLFQLNEVKEKMKKTCLERYGVENPSQSDIIKQKVKNTCLERYGVEYTSQIDEVKEKVKKTCLERYGVEYCMQNEEILTKQQKTRFHLKDYVFPSGNIIQVQGYEPLALDILLKTVSEEDLLTGYKNKPVIWYEMDNKKRRYHTDIFIPLQNKCIEVKSDYTFNVEMEQNLLKQEATKLLGFECEIWIFDKNKKLIKILI